MQQRVFLFQQRIALFQELHLETPALRHNQQFLRKRFPSPKRIHHLHDIRTRFQFIRFSDIINLFHVKEYLRGEGGTAILSNDKAVEVSRRKKEQFIGLIREHFKI